MKINNLKYSQLNKTLQSNKLLLDLDHTSPNQIFRTQKILSSKTYRSFNKFDKKYRTLSSTPKASKQYSNKNNFNKNQNVKEQVQVVRMRPASCDTFKKNASNFLEKQQTLNRPRTATNRFYTGLQLKKCNKKQDIFLQLSKQIKRYIINIITEEQKRQTIDQLKLLLNILQKQKQITLILLHLKKLQNQLSRFLKHRISHLFFYLIYCKFLASVGKQNIQQQVKILTLSEYHSRTFHFRKVSLLICMQIQQKFIKLNSYDESRSYAIKSLKLAVLLEDRYYEVKMLEYIGVLKYYEGVLNSKGSNLLSEQERINIVRLYNEDDQIPKIFNFLDKNQQNTKKDKYNVKQSQINEKSIISHFDKTQFYFNQGQNYVTYGVPTSNLKKFNRNLHGIAKKLNKVTNVKASIQKASQVGEVKKFFGKDNYITLYPQANSLKNTFQSQVFLTHKKYADIQKGNTFMNKQLPAIIIKLQNLIMTENLHHTENIDYIENY